MQHDPWMVAILLPEPATTEWLTRSLGPAVERRESRHDVAMRPDHSLVTRRGDLTILVDLFARPWHDTSGNDQGPTSPTYAHDPDREHLLAQPWSLKRAVQHYRGNDDAAIMATQHQAFLLLRVPLQPAGNSTDALGGLLQAVLQLMEQSLESCFFNPRGEVLRGVTRLREALERSSSADVPPVELATNVRMFEIGAGWSLTDVVGLSQFELPDQEVVFTESHLSAADALNYARSLALHVIQHRPTIKPGDTAGGPGEGIWEALPLGQGAYAPSRAVVRWLPENREGMPKGMELP